MRDAIFLIVLAGCSGTKEEPGNGAQDGDGGPAVTADDAGGSDASASADSDAGRHPHEAGVVTIDSGPDAGGGACADKATKTACMQCCDTENPGGRDTTEKALLGCACKTEHCATACATSICAAMPSPPDAGDPCMACVQASFAPDAGTTGCLGEVESACMADPICVALQQCASACGDKP